VDPNRSSYAAAVERLDGFASGDRPVPLSGIGDELLAVAALLEGQPGLRRALTDPSRAADVRAGLLNSLLDNKVAEDTRALLRILVAGRWSSGAELLNAVERLGVEALLASADSAGELAEVEDELFRFGQLVDGDLELAAALGFATAPLPNRARLAHTLLDGKVHSVTLRLVDVALRGFGGRNFSPSLSRLVELAAGRRERELAYVTVAKSLTEAEQDRLAARLSEIYGHPVDLKVSVAPEILGGVRVRVGFDMYDATMLRRITDARTKLVGRHP
jgi:F-type H+-transporting ATPase subunit delta